jgi:hypothetical protein
VQVYDPRGFRDAFGVEAAKDRGLRLGALVFAVEDIGKARALLSRNEIAAHEHAGRLVVGPEAAHGAVLALSA